MAPFLQTFAAPVHTATKHPQGRQPPALCWCLFSSRQSPRGRQASQGTDFRMCEAGCRFNGLLPQAYRWRFKWQALQLFSMRNVKLKKKIKENPASELFNVVFMWPRLMHSMGRQATACHLAGQAVWDAWDDQGIKGGAASGPWGHRLCGGCRSTKKKSGHQLPFRVPELMGTVLLTSTPTQDKSVRNHQEGRKP